MNVVDSYELALERLMRLQRAKSDRCTFSKGKSFCDVECGVYHAGQRHVYFFEYFSQRNLVIVSPARVPNDEGTATVQRWAALMGSCAAFTSVSRYQLPHGSLAKQGCRMPQFLKYPLRNHSY